MPPGQPSATAISGPEFIDHDAVRPAIVSDGVVGTGRPAVAGPR
jgi:hypothetical protein